MYVACFSLAEWPYCFGSRVAELNGITLFNIDWFQMNENKIPEARMDALGGDGQWLSRALLPASDGSCFQTTSDKINWRSLVCMELRCGASTAVIHSNMSV